MTSLLELARAKAEQRHERSAALAAELSGTPHGVLTDSNRALMTGMLRGLVAEATDALRTGVAARSELDGRERSALDALAVDAVIAPLRRSGVLTDPALIEAAYFRLLEFHLGGRGRARLSPSPGSGHSDIVAGLLAEGDPAVRPALTAFLIAQAKRVDAYGNPMIPLDEVPEPVLATLLWAVAAAFRVTLAPTSDEADRTVPLDAAIEAAADAVLGAVRAGSDSAGRLDHVARLLIGAGLVGPETLAPLLAAGEVSLFEAVFARLAGVAPGRLRQFLFEPGGEALAVCARAIRLARDDLAAILSAAATARQRPRAVDASEVDAALALYDGAATETVARLMGHWARGRDYLWMVQRIDAVAEGDMQRFARR